jgi:hypothetical protein
MRNQIVDEMPSDIKTILARACFPLRFFSFKRNKMNLAFIGYFSNKDNRVFDL